MNTIYLMLGLVGFFQVIDIMMSLNLPQGAPMDFRLAYSAVTGAFSGLIVAALEIEESLARE